MTIYRISTGVFRPIYGDGRRTIRTAPTGFPDIIGVQRRMAKVKRVINPDGFQPVEQVIDLVYGQAIAIETKTTRGVQTQEQRDFQADFEHKGGIYILARSVEDVLRVLGADRTT